MKTAMEFIKEIDEDGQEWSDDTEVLARYFDDYAKLYHEDKTRWISVEERLPETTDKLRFESSGVIMYGYYSIRNKIWCDLESKTFYIPSTVKRWQPLPSPPKP